MMMSFSRLERLPDADLGVLAVLASAADLRSAIDAELDRRARNSMPEYRGSALIHDDNQRFDYGAVLTA